MSKNIGKKNYKRKFLKRKIKKVRKKVEKYKIEEKKRRRKNLCLNNLKNYLKKKEKIFCSKLNFINNIYKGLIHF